VKDDRFRFAGAFFVGLRKVDGSRSCLSKIDCIAHFTSIRIPKNSSDPPVVVHVLPKRRSCKPLIDNRNPYFAWYHCCATLPSISKSSVDASRLDGSDERSVERTSLTSARNTGTHCTIIVPATSEEYQIADMPRRQKYSSSLALPWYFQWVRTAVLIAITIPYCGKC
jgi:hypothetical protein